MPIDVSIYDPHEPTIALLPWGNVIEDFLDAIGISFERFCQEMTGGWLFGYVEALKQVGIRSVLICFSANVKRPTRYRHQPTGAVIWALPASSAYLAIRRQMLNPYGFTVQATFGKSKQPWLSPLRDLAPYLATPLRSLTAILKQENCCTLLCQEYEYARFDICIWLGQRLNLPVYASFQGGDFQISHLEKRLRTASMRACAGLIIAPNSEIRRVTERYGVPREKISRIFNPLDLSLWEGGNGAAARYQLGISDSAQVVVWHGRVDLHRKGLDILLEAWQQVSLQRLSRNLCLLLVGTGSDVEALQARIDELQLTNLHWINEYILERARLRDYLYAADLYVLPSRHEGFAVAPLEAMACKLPIVATNISGISDLLEKGEAMGGIIVSKENVCELSRAIGKLLDDDEYRKKLSIRAYQRVSSTFCLKSVGSQLKNFLNL